jgi:hypothetical protein
MSDPVPSFDSLDKIYDPSGIAKHGYVLLFTLF